MLSAKIRMARLHGVVYDPPSSEFPPLVVVFSPDAEVLAARAAPSIEAAEAFLETIINELQDQIDKDLGKK
jgi:hypothetical protein